MKLLNTAVIGAGAIHGCHVNALRQLPNVALRALADIDSVKGLKLALGLSVPLLSGLPGDAAG